MLEFLLDHIRNNLEDYLLSFNRNVRNADEEYISEFYEDILTDCYAYAQRYDENFVLVVPLRNY